MFHAPNKHRITDGPLGSPNEAGNNGAFRFKKKGTTFTTIISDQLGWEHVSVSIEHRCPTWKEMCFIKSVFWDDEDCVIQYHPPASEYVNNHPYCLHLWRPISKNLPMPPSIMVGLKDT